MEHKKQGYLYILIAGILWGSIGLFVNLLKAQGAGPQTIAFLRIGTAALLLIPFMLASGGSRMFRIPRRGLLSCAALGIFSQAMFNISYNVSIQNVGVATASVLLYSSPIFVCVMSKIFFRETIGKVKQIALLINILGCILTVTNGDFSAISFSVLGVVTGVLAGFLYALMTIISKAATENYHPLTVLFYSFVFGTAAIALIAKPWQNLADVLSLRFTLMAFGYGLIPTVGSYIFYLRGLRCGLETSKVPVIASIETVVAAMIGILLFQEAVGPFKLLGIVCVLASIAIMNREKENTNA